MKYYAYRVKFLRSLLAVEASTEQEAWEKIGKLVHPVTVYDFHEVSRDNYLSIRDLGWEDSL